MHTKVESLFDALWQDYIAITPSAKAVHELLSTGEEEILNDHVAFRTFDRAKVNLDKLAAHFIALGYEAKGDYDFVYFEKKGRLYFDGNGSGKNWGDRDEGGLVAILKGKPELTAENFTLLA